MPSGQPTGTEPRMFDLNRPQGYAKDDYLWQWKVANDTIFDIIRRNNGNQNTRDIVMSVMFSISLIAHDDLRRKQEILFHAALDYISTMKDADGKSVPTSRQADEVIRICAITMGNLTSYVDQFRGLAHTLKVGELYNQEKNYAKITSAFGKPPEPEEVIEI
jgi:hypothetical protein